MPRYGAEIVRDVTIGCKSRAYRGCLVETLEIELLRVGVAMEMLLHSNGDLQDSTVALVIDVRNMWEVFMEGSHFPPPPGRD
jgi:hypothetical protein